MPPSISSSEALVIWMLRIAMKAPIMHARTAIQSLVLARAGAAPDAAIAFGMAGASQTCRLISTFVGGPDATLGRLGVDARDHRHSGPEVSPVCAIGVEEDLHRNP